MEILEQMVHDGRAIEVENIAPILQTLAGDEAVLQRVQRRARALLAGSQERLTANASLMGRKLIARNVV